MGLQVVADSRKPSKFWSGAGHSSAAMDWGTPGWIFERLDREFAFELDAAASAENTKCPMFLSEDDDSLSQSWVAPQSYSTRDSVGSDECWSIWLNPPYGRGTGDWMRKAYEESQEGATVVCLVSACTDTKWWADWVWKAAEVRFVTGRLKFARGGETPNSAPKGSAIVIFVPWSQGPPICRLLSR